METSQNFIQVGGYDPDTEPASVTTHASSALRMEGDSTAEIHPEYPTIKVYKEQISWKDQHCRHCGYLIRKVSHIESENLSLCRYNGSEKVRVFHPACPAFFPSE